jgi:hypothetical protein
MYSVYRVLVCTTGFDVNRTVFDQPIKFKRSGFKVRLTSEKVSMMHDAASCITASSMKQKQLRILLSWRFKLRTSCMTYPCFFYWAYDSYVLLVPSSWYYCKQTVLVLEVPDSITYYKYSVLLRTRYLVVCHAYLEA